ncbi:Aste57867_3743 [Aphanomyces stellatus]|uniref:Aste57867_3743 protein n=1 Tax=Aphanomyces stellatus TaxID=120398 RepID=A0A485KAA6_9STRA|nr:hypothetical protein As57867_003732 [Aphanomyces stellatus]VFT80895.1 Aste57867_3743 [Aphanomyces stellatus]
METASSVGDGNENAQTSIAMLDLHEVFHPKTLEAHFNDVRQVLLPNGLRIEYALHGEDDAPEKVVMIMGMQGEKEAWLPLVSTLLHPSNSGAASKYQLVTFDNRGVGNSDKPWGWYSTSQMARDALMLMDHLRWSKAHVVGASMGGMIAQELAYAAPERVLSLALMVTTPGFRQGALPGMSQVTSYLSLAQNMVYPTHHRVASTMLYALFPDDFLQERHAGGDLTAQAILYKHHMERLKTVKMSLAGVLGHYSAVLFHNVTRDRLKVIADSDFPIVVIAAKKDRMLHPDNSKVLYKTLRGGKQTEAIVFENAGHDVHVQQRGEVAEALDKLFMLGSQTKQPRLAAHVPPSNGHGHRGKAKKKKRRGSK